MTPAPYREAPSQSPVKIEIPPAVLHEVQSKGQRAGERGYLLGFREGNIVQVMAAVAALDSGDSRLAELDIVGVYASRARGEVFLTDADLEHAESVPNGVALVVAGKRAGFFPREANGSIQAVRSREEFTISEAAKPAAVGQSSRPRHTRHPALPPVSRWKRIAMAVGLLAGPIAGMAYLRDRMPLPPLNVTVQESNGQLVIGWDRSAVAGGGYLEIAEGEIRSVLSVGKDSTSALYSPTTGDVEVRLKAGGRTGMAHWKAARYGR